MIHRFFYFYPHKQTTNLLFMELQELIKQQKEKLQNTLTSNELAFGEIIFNNNDCQVLSQSAVRFELFVTAPDSKIPVECSLEVEEDGLLPLLNDEISAWNSISYACLLEVENELRILDPREPVEHKKYTREGMIKRVLLERRQKAEKAKYRIKWANNIYGDHILTNERGIK